MICGLIGQSVSSSTLKTYKRGVRCLHDFRSKHNLANCWPISVQELCNFIAYLFLQNLSHSSIKCYLSGISFFHKVNGYDDATQTFIIGKMMEGIKRSRGKIIDSKLPITRGMLKTLLITLNAVCRSQYEVNLFKAAFSLAFHGLLRIGEFAVSNGVHRHVLLLSNVRFEGNQLKIFIHSSKTDQLGAGSYITVQKQSDSTICPCSLLKRFMHDRPPLSGPLFCHFDGKPLTRRQFVSLLNKALACAGIENTRFTSHSFRIGAATSLAMEGVPDSIIMQLGRWKSNAYKGYIRT